MFVKSSENVIESLESPTFTLNQVALNISQIETLCHTFSNANSYESVKEIDEDTGLEVAKIIYDPPPERLRYLVANSIYDLRHTCDQITCAAVAMSTGTDARNVYFPVGNSKADYDRRVALSIPHEFQATYNRFKGYPSMDGENPMGDMLVALSKAAQRKHSIHCRPVAIVSHMVGGRIIKGSGKGFIHIPPKSIPNRNEIVLGSYEAGTEFEYSSKLMFRLSVFGAGEFDGTHPADLVKGLHFITYKILRDVRRAALSRI